MTDEKRTTTKTLKDYFGIKEGEKMLDFAEELKKLSTEEKEQLAAGIEDGSFNY